MNALAHTATRARWLRQGSIILRAFIVIFIIIGAQSVSVSASYAFDAAKTAKEAVDPFIIENVFVIDPSEEPDISLSFLEKFNIVDGQFGRTKKFLGGFAGRDYAMADIAQHTYWIKWIGGKFNIAAYFLHYSWRLSKIFEAYFYRRDTSPRDISSACINPFSNTAYELQEIVLPLDNIEVCPFGGDSSVCGLLAASAAIRVERARLMVKIPRIVVKIAITKVPRAVITGFFSVT